MRDEVLTYQEGSAVVANLGVSERATFIGRTYTHLFGAVIAFVLTLVVLFRTGAADGIVAWVSGGSLRWLVFLGGFVVVGLVASRMAMKTTSLASQYLALFGYVVVEAIIFVPLIWMADRFAPGAIQSAALMTLVGFTGLTATVFLTRKDFSFLGGIIGLIGTLALLVIIGAIVFGFSLGMWFSIAMVALAGASILFETSNILHHYPADKHVAAALGLFASVALLFYYLLMLFLQMQE